jgi:hypothetical protein
MNFYVYKIMMLVLKYSFFLITVTSSVTASCVLEVRGSRKIRGLFVILYFLRHRFKWSSASFYSTTFQNIQGIYNIFF